MLGKLLLIFFSLSIRTPYIEDCPLDYEIRGGFETQQLYMDVLREREYGDMWWGGDLIYKVPGKAYEWALGESETLGISADIYIREAKSMNSQSLDTLWKISDKAYKLYIGGSFNTYHWKDIRNLLTVKLKLGILQFSIKSNFIDRELTTIKISKIIPAGKHGAYFKPLLKYKSMNEDVNFQAKVEIGVKF